MSCTFYRPHKPRRYVFLATWIVLLSAGLRMFRLLDQSIWYDEAFNVLYAQKPVSDILAAADRDTMPPLHYLLLHLWMSTGTQELIARLYPVYVGVLATAAVYPIGRRLLGPKVGLGGALLTTLSPFQVYYAREVRMYSQLLFLALLSVLFLVRCMQGQDERERGHPLAEWGNWAAWVLFATLTVYTHALGFLVPLAVGAAALALNRHRPRFVRRLLFSGMALVLCAMPWAWWVLPAQAERVIRHFWVDRPSLLAPWVTLHMFLAGYAIPASWIPVSLFVTLSLGAIAVYQALRERGPPLLFLLAWFLGPIVGVWVLSLYAPIYLDRLFIASAPALYLLVSWSLGRMPRGLGYALGAGLLALVFLSLGQYYYGTQFHKPPMRAAAAYVADRVVPGDLVLHTSDGSLLPFAFYEPQLDQAPIAGDPEHQTDGARALSLDILGFEPLEPDQALSRPGRVWLVVALDHSVEYQKQMSDRLLEARTTAHQTGIGGIGIYLLAAPREAP
jgi:uncharacterized membrane protein